MIEKTQTNNEERTYLLGWQQSGLMKQKNPNHVTPRKVKC